MLAAVHSKCSMNGFECFEGQEGNGMNAVCTTAGMQRRRRAGTNLVYKIPTKDSRK